MNDRPLYRLRRLRVDRGNSFRLRIEHLEIPAGTVLGLLGPTGAGKSTLLRLLGGLETPSGGEAWFGDDRLGDGSLSLPTRRRITMVFQHPRLLSGTVRANVEFGRRLRGGNGRYPAADAVIEALGLSRLAARSARELSVGQAQLLALARALAIEPDVLLLDEPTAHLDPAHVALVERTIAEDHRRRGTTVIWATHNPFQARRVAQRVGLLLDGELVEDADRVAFFESPADPRASAFVRGEMIY